MEEFIKNDTLLTVSAYIRAKTDEKCISNKSAFIDTLHYIHRTSAEVVSRKDDTMLQTRYNSIKAYLANGTVPSSLPSTVSNFRREASKYRLEPNGELSREGKRVALYKDRMKIFKAFHQHAGRDASWKKIKARYYWRGGQAFVAKKVNECVACAHKNDQLWKATLPKLKAIPVKPKAFWRGITY